MTISPITNRPFTTEDADRLLGLGDQFMEDWQSSLEENGGDAADLAQWAKRRLEWDAIRPLLAQAPAMFALIEQLIEKSGDLQAAIEGTTDQVEAEVSALSAVASAAEGLVASFRHEEGLT